MTMRKLLLSTISAAAMLAASHETAMAADADAGAADAGGLEEIVVTARKREENLLKVPVAITAITGEDLAKQGIKSFNQLVDNTPGINMTNLGGGGGRSDRSFQQITLRGFVPSTTLSTLTSTFIDGVPVASPTAVASVSDPARVEILKGPQAAYFGRNTFAGAINVINRQPGNEVGGSMSILAGTRGNLDFTGSLSGPLAGDRLGFRLAGKYFTKDGSYRNAAVTDGRLGDQRTKSINLLLTAKITDNFSAKLFGLYSEDKDGAPVQGLVSAYEVRAVNGLTSVPAQGGSTAGTVIIPGSSNCTINGFRFGDGRPNGPLPTDNAVVARPWVCGAVPSINTALTPAQNAVPASLLAPSIANGAQRVVSASEGAQGYGLVRTYTHAHLNLDYQFGDSGFTLTSLTGLNAEHWSEIADLDNFDSRLLANPNATNVANVAQGTPINAYWDFVFGVERETYDFSQEVRLAFDNKGPFSGVLGVSMIDTSVWNDLVNYSNEVLGVRSSNTLTASLVTGHTSVGKSPVKNKGIFFGATYALTDALKLSVEGRYQEDRVIGLTSSSAAGTRVTPAAAAAFNIPAGFYGPLSKLIEAKYKNFLPRAIVQYNINPDVMAYASYSKGVNVGTNTFNTTFLSQSAQSIAVAAEMGLTVAQKPEKLVNYEVGLKGKFFDNRLQLQGAAYYAIWTDQLNNRSRTFLDNGPDGIGTAQLVSGLANTGETALKGLEVEIKAAPVEHVELNFAAAMTDSSIRTFTTPGVTQYSGLIGNDFKGKQLPLSSKYSLNLGGMYSNSLDAWQDGSWFARADVSWKDKQFADATNITWIKSRTVVNLRAGVAKGPLSVEAYVLNAFNDKNYTGVITGTVLTPTFSLTGATSSMLLQLPDLRSAGLQVAYKF